MRRKFVGFVAGALVALSALGAASASASTEIGNNCTGNEAVGGFTMLQLASGSGSLPMAAPANGVITNWKVNVIPFSGSIPEQLKIFSGSGNSFTTVAESETGTVRSGQNTFAARIPIQAGDRVGVYSTLETIFCVTGNPADKMGIFNGNATVGGTQTYLEAPELQPAITAVIEPDVDNDGYGDETQDKCPQSAAYQTPCPVVALSATSSAKKGLVTISITSSLSAPVTVGGAVKLGKGRTATLSGGTQAVAPGAIATFTLKFSKKLKSKLKELSPKQKLSLSVTATAPNLVGPATSTSLTVKLKGQKKPKHKHHKKG